MEEMVDCVIIVKFVRFIVKFFESGLVSNGADRYIRG